MLRELFLYGNRVKDEGCRIIVESLRTNRRLRRLGIKITSQEGFASFIPVVCDASDVQSTLNSNHVLTSVTTGETVRVPADLSKLLDTNRNIDKSTVAKLKVLRCHFNGNFDLTATAGLDDKALPYLLGWFGSRRLRYSKSADLDDGQTCRSAFYRIVRHNPVLCGYPSYERAARLKAEDQVATLEQKLDGSESRNEELRREVKLAKLRIESLVQELDEVRSNKRLKCCEQK